ncbi:ABC transporter permease [Mycolicibacterium canariasense]|uniref:ABC transporter permease n=1 Tax=Mycolicibacterium canariasense TaxID=228230 RepID=A0A124E3G3_MYCCR|nr:ABC transporter permease [Mycolicibacterium canariasense]MCV7207729.1 ABC transporter permease [Mycolicibacterium canariasense]ORV08932.1 ABC transporter permease [Mycolicibacterium canariasense]GAS99844.1 ABC transporter permease [Mycolicibacterium canariasense]
MTASPATTVYPAPAQERPSAVTARDIARAGATRRARDSRVKIWIGGIAALIVILPVAFARILPVPSPDATDLAARRLPPLTGGHLFGTDQLGRDVLARVLYGGQVSLAIGILAVVVSGLIGLTLGAIAGYRGGWVDTVVSRLLEAQLSLPLLMMLLLVVALFGPSIPVITFVIAIAQWPEIARLTRSLTLVEREKPYVAAAHVLGLGRTAILLRHIIPNIVKQVSLVVLLLLAQAVLLESALSYLGAGPQRPFATWGRIISDGQDYVTTSWWLVTLPGLAIALLVVGVNLLGDGLRDHAGFPKTGLLSRFSLRKKAA